MTMLDAYAPCPCKSGKKYKFCCMQADREKARAGQHHHHPHAGPCHHSHHAPAAPAKKSEPPSES